MSDGHQSEKRTLFLHRVDTSQLQAPVHVVTGRTEQATNDELEDEDDTPLTLKQSLSIVAMGLASWAIVGLIFWVSFRLAEVFR